MIHQKFRLLLADRQCLLIEGLQYLLKQHSHIEVIEVAINGQEAIAKSNANNIDVVLMDVDLPIIDGIQSTMIIKNLYPSLKVIILSATRKLNTIINALNAGADGFVSKDINCSELIKALHVINSDKIYLSKDIALFFPINIFRTKTKNKRKYSSEKFVTACEKRVLRLITEGYTNQQIADILVISVRTADTHRKNLLAKLKLPNTASLVKFAIENSLV